MSIITYKCPNCGGALSFNDGTKGWKCEYCLSIFYMNENKSMEEKNVSEEDHLKVEAFEEEIIVEETFDDTEFVDKARTYCCKGCGTEIVTDNTTPVEFCYYCNDTEISPVQLPENYRPSKVIPFKISKDEAVNIFKEWCKSSLFRPFGVTSKAPLQRIAGKYIPLWLFDYDVKGGISADARKINTWVNGNKRYTQSECYDVRRTVKISFKDIPEYASTKFGAQLVELLETYDYTQLAELSMEHLHGFFAETYDVDQKKVYESIAGEVLEHSYKLMGNTIFGYESVTLKGCSPDIKKVNITCALLPIWIFIYRNSGNTDIVAINGQTGDLTGGLPKSLTKIAAYFLTASGIVFTALWFGGVLI